MYLIKQITYGGPVLIMKTCMNLNFILHLSFTNGSAYVYPYCTHDTVSLCNIVYFIQNYSILYFEALTLATSDDIMKVHI